MSLNESQGTPEFALAEEELECWKESYYTLKRARNDQYERLNAEYQVLNQKYRQLLNNQCTDQDPGEVEDAGKSLNPFDDFSSIYEHHPRIKTWRQSEVMKTDAICMDPLEQLPELCANKIMSYLSGNDLINSMLVSKRWNDFIKVRGSLMDKIVVKPSFEYCSLQMMHKIVNSEDKRSYKHMVTPYILQQKSYAIYHPLISFASTLETLTINQTDVFPWSENHEEWSAFTYENKEVIELKPCIFPKLRKLTLSRTVPYEFFKRCSFPALKYLHITPADYVFHMNSKYFYDPRIVCFLALCPQLEVLWDDGWACNPYEFEPKTEKLQKLLPKIKVLRSDNYVEHYLRDYQSSLKKIEINVVDKHDMCEILEHFQALKRLTINELRLSVYNLSDPEMEKLFMRGYASNDSIEVLHIFSLDNFQSDNIPSHGLQNVLLALPSLRQLYLGRNALTKDILKIIACNLRHLEKLSCNSISEELLHAHQEIQTLPHLYVNSTFQFIEEQIFLNYDLFPNDEI